MMKQTDEGKRTALSPEMVDRLADELHVAGQGAKAKSLVAAR